MCFIQRDGTYHLSGFIAVSKIVKRWFDMFDKVTIIQDVKPATILFETRKTGFDRSYGLFQVFVYLSNLKSSMATLLHGMFLLCHIFLFLIAILAESLSVFSSFFFCLFLSLSHDYLGCVMWLLTLVLIMWWENILLPLFQKTILKYESKPKS